MKSILRILLTGAGSPAASGVIRSLRSSADFDFFIVCMDCSAHAVGFHMGDQWVVGPRAREEEFIPFVKQICMEKKIDILLSLVTDELVKLSAAQSELLKLGCRLAISTPESLQKVIHKGCLYRELQALGIPVPMFYMAHTVEELKSSIHNLGYPQDPICFKPVISDGSRGFHILDNKVDRIQLLFHEKPNSAYISESELFGMLKDRTDIPETIVMEYLPYEEYSVDLLVNQGKAVIAVPRLREATLGGITTRGVIKQEQDIIDYAVQVVQALQLNGNIGVQVRRDLNRLPKIVEINPRIQGTIVHCTAAGINLPVLAVKQLLGIAPSEEELKVNWGTRMKRYWEEVFYHADGSSYTI